MKAIILSAGYNTYMYPLTKNQPKALLPVGGKLLIDSVVEQIAMLPEVNQIIVVSNQKYISLFEEWSKNIQSAIPITILNDGSISEVDSLGDIGDIYLALYNKEIKEDILVVTGGCYMSSALLKAYKVFMEKQRDMVCVQEATTHSFASYRFIPILDDDGKVLSLEKIKSTSPSDIISSDICFFKADTLPIFDRYVYEGNDQYIYEGDTLYGLGNFLQWLCREKDIYAIYTNEETHEIKTIDEYETLRDKLGKSTGDIKSIIIEHFYIFLIFAKIGALTFGAGYNMLPMLNKELAIKRKWVTLEEITDYFVVSQCLPGLTVVKTSALLGYRYKKGLGALAAGLGIAFPVLVSSLLIAIFFDQLIEIEIVRHIFNGLQVAVLALLIEAVIQMWKTGIKKDIFCIIIFIISVFAFAIFNISPVLFVLFGGISGLIFRHFAKEKKVAT